MALYSDAAQAALDEYQNRVVTVGIRMYRNSRLASSENIVIALGESFESLQASIIRCASQKDGSTPTQYSLSAVWQDDPPSGFKVVKLHKNSFLGDFTNLTNVNEQNLGGVLRLMKARSEKDALLVTLSDAPKERLAELRKAQGMGSERMPHDGLEKRTNERNDQSSLGVKSKSEDVTQTVNPSAFIGEMFAAQMRGSAEAKRKSTRDNSPRRRQGGTGWVDEDETYPRDPHDRSTQFEVAMPNKARSETNKDDQRSESAKDEAKSESATRKSSNLSPSMDHDDNIHESHRHLFGPRH